MSLIVNLLCFSGGAIFGICVICVFIAGGRADKEVSIK